MIGDYAGSVRIYGYSSGTWTKLGQDIDGKAGGDQSGRSVSLNSAGDRVAIGAIWNDGSGMYIIICMCICIYADIIYNTVLIEYVHIYNIHIDKLR